MLLKEFYTTVVISEDTFEGFLRVHGLLDPETCDNGNECQKCGAEIKEERTQRGVDTGFTMPTEGLSDDEGTNMFRDQGKRFPTVHWFRHGLRLHDNPAMLEAVRGSTEFYAVFIFDGHSAGTCHVGYNRMKFLLESLIDLDAQLKKHGGQLYMLRGNPSSVFRRLWEEVGIKKICFEQDCEPIWNERDRSVVEMCNELGIECVEKVSHTLWDPKLVIQTNGGIPPLTYQMFLHTTSVIGPPPRPCSDIDFAKVKFGVLPPYLCQELNVITAPPTPEDFGLEKEKGNKLVIWVGGETRALKHLESRVKLEESAFAQRILLTNQTQPNLVGAPTSQSAAVRFGCLSIRRFYWTIHDLFDEMYEDMTSLSQKVTGQLIWREYFYTMSVDNLYYAEMERNPICLKINWLPRTDPTYKKKFESWKNGMTGYPFIDAVMRQLQAEGWVHHVARNAVACFLTRGDLWISWEDGLKHFLKYLLDADWSVCAGNWMYVSSSAFEQLLDCSFCICPVNFGRRLDPYGEYVKRYVNEVRQLPVEYIYEPWAAPIEVQEQAGCVIGRDYPERIVDHNQVSSENSMRMESIRRNLLNRVPHCCPSNTEEIRQFMWLPPELHEHISKLAVDDI